jgi:hypothetical protein
MSEYNLRLVALCHHCNATYQVPDELANRSVKCKTCGTEVAVQISKPAKPVPVQQVVTPVYHEPLRYGESNGLAVAGFVFALLGFCTAALLSPIALGCSIAGLRKSANRGYAVAGTIIASIQLVILAFFCIQFIFVGAFIWEASGDVSDFVEEATQRYDTVIAQTTTEKSMAESVVAIDSHAISLGELPPVAEGNDLIEFDRDGWGTPLKYEPPSGRITAYRIRSAGPDALWDTSDDIGRNVPTPIASNPAEAIMLLREHDIRRQQFGLDWLLVNDPQDRSRELVVQALKPLLRNAELRATTARALLRWADAEQFQQVAEDRELDGEEIVEIFVEQQNPMAILPFLNDEDYSTRKKARTAIAAMEVDADAVVAQCLHDLNDNKHDTYAVEFLLDFDLDENAAQQVKKVVLARMLSSDIGGTTTDSAMDLIQKSNLTDEDLSMLMRIFTQNSHEAIFDVLKENVDDSMVQFFLATMKQTGSASSRSAEFFERLGPAAESHLWEALEGNSSSDQRISMRVLEKIGTTLSIPHLKPLLENSAVKRDAQRTIDAIQQAGREPVPIPTG